MLLADPEVTVAVVVGEDDPVLGSVPVAYLVVDATSGHDEPNRERTVVERVRLRCEGSLPRPKRPARYHVAVAVPTGATG